MCARRFFPPGGSSPARAHGCQCTVSWIRCGHPLGETETASLCHTQPFLSDPLVFSTSRSLQPLDARHPHRCSLFTLFRAPYTTNARLLFTQLSDYLAIFPIFIHIFPSIFSIFSATRFFPKCVKIFIHFSSNKNCTTTELYINLNYKT